MGSSQTRAWTRVPCIGSRILNHCATREAPLLNTLKIKWKMAAGSNYTNTLFWCSRKWIIWISCQTFIFFLKFKLRLWWQQNIWMIWKLGQLNFWTQLPSYVNLNKTSFLSSALAEPSTMFAKMLLIITNNENFYRELNSLSNRVPLRLFQIHSTAPCFSPCMVRLFKMAVFLRSVCPAWSSAYFTYTYSHDWPSHIFAPGRS